MKFLKSITVSLWISTIVILFMPAPATSGCTPFTYCYSDRGCGYMDVGCETTQPTAFIGSCDPNTCAARCGWDCYIDP